MSRSKKRKKRKLKKDRLIFVSLFILIIILGILFIFNLFSSYRSYAKTSPISPSTEKVDDIVNITLSAVGDIMVHDAQLNAQYDKTTQSYSFDNNFKYIAPYISASDLSIANLETTLAGSNFGYSSFPKFNSPDSLVSAIKNSGFDIVSNINNHTYDRGSAGLYRTLDVISNEGMNSIGTRKDSSENNFLIKDINGVKLGITSFSYGEVSQNRVALNGLPLSDNDKNNANVFDLKDVDDAFNSIKLTLDSMNNTETDLQVLVLHWGNEYYREPTSFQKELAKKLCDYGVDIIIGSHPHVVQPIEMINSTENNNETLVIYSLGNFLSNQRKEILNRDFTEDGLIVDINISKNFSTDKTTISSVEYIPTWVNKYTDNENKLNYEIIPIVNKDQILSIDNLPYDKIKYSYDNTTSIIGDSDIIKVKNN